MSEDEEDGKDVMTEDEDDDDQLSRERRWVEQQKRRQRGRMATVGKNRVRLPDGLTGNTECQDCVALTQRLAEEVDEKQHALQSAAQAENLLQSLGVHWSGS